MNRFILTLFITTWFCATAYAQSQTDSIVVIKKWSTTYWQKGRNLSMGGLLYITKNNPEAYKEMKQAQTNFTCSFLSGCAGGICVGIPVGTALGGGIPDWNIALAGAGFIGAAIVFEHAFNKHATRGAQLHNSSLKTQGAHKPQLNFGMHPNGLGLGFSFN